MEINLKAYAVRHQCRIVEKLVNILAYIQALSIVDNNSHIEYSHHPRGDGWYLICAIHRLTNCGQNRSSISYQEDWAMVL